MKKSKSLNYKGHEGSRRTSFADFPWWTFVSFVVNEFRSYE